MNDMELAKLFKKRQLEIDPRDPRDMVEIGLTLGVIGLRPLGVEPTDTFDQVDIKAMRRNGKVVKSIGFGQAIFEAVPSEELEDSTHDDGLVLDLTSMHPMLAMHVVRVTSLGGTPEEASIVRDILNDHIADNLNSRDT